MELKKVIPICSCAKRTAKNIVLTNFTHFYFDISAILLVSWLTEDGQCTPQLRPTQVGNRKTGTEPLMHIIAECSTDLA